MTIATRWNPDGPLEPGADEPPRRRTPSPRVVAIVLVLVGVAALLYPVIVTQYNNQRHRQFAEQYDHQVQQVPAATLSEQFRRAQEYNRGIDGIPILDPWLAKVAGQQSSAAYQAYLGQLNALDAMARIRVPAAGIDLPVRHGTTEESLTSGAGHLYGTSLPVGGKGTHAVLTSHTGLGTATLFDHLADVKEGDVFFVDVAGRTLAYRVDRISVVLPGEIGDLTPVKDHDYLTLFTCTPYAINTHRLLVRGERIDDPAEAARAADSVRPPVMETWMWWMLAGAATGLGVAATLAFRRGSREPASESSPEE